MIGQNLSGADFTGQNICGVNFENTNLVGAKFTRVVAGIPLVWAVIFLIGGLLASFIVGYITGYSSTVLAFINSLLNEEDSFGRGLLSIVIILILMTFLGLTVRHGMRSGIGAFAIMVAGLVTITAALGSRDITAASVVAAMLVAGAITAIILGAVTTTTSLMLVTKKSIGLSLVVFSLALGAVPGILEGIGFLDDLSSQSPVWDFVSSCLIALVLIGFTLWVGWQSFCKNPKYRLSHAIALWLVTSRATRFRGADLTDADFTQAKLDNVDLRQATLTRTNWFQAIGLEQARVDRTYLEYPQILRLVTSGNGKDKQFDHLDLRGVNLHQTNLADASFMGANLSEASLEGADLSRANLVQAQLYRTNLTRSCLTGAYIQNWGISVETQLEEVTCDYVYMRLPTKEDPDPCRKPDNHKETFKPGEFADFIAPILKTLDLYQQQDVDPRTVATTFDLFHHQGIDPSAAAIALQQLAEQHPESGIEVIALEGRGNENIRLQARVKGEANRSALSAAYFENYSQLKTLPYNDLQALLAGVAEKDVQIRQLSKMLETAIHQPKFYVETYQNQGEFIMSQSQGNIRIGDVQGKVSGIAAAGENQSMTGVALGTISGSVTNTIHQLPSSPNPDSPSIKELLVQLQEAIESEAELPDEDKTEALEQVKTLAEAGLKPEDNALKKAAKTSIKILKGTVASLPDAAKLAEACAQLLPAIATLLALV